MRSPGSTSMTRPPWLAVSILLVAGCGSVAEDLPERVQSVELSLTCVTIQTGGTGSIADAYVRSGTPNVNFGAAMNLLVGTMSGATHGPLLLPDVSSIPSNAIVQQSTLTLLRNASVGLGPITSHEVLGPWTELGVTWNTRPATNPAALSSVAIIPGPTSSLSLDLTALTQAWVSGASVNHGVWLAVATGAAQFASGDVSFPSERTMRLVPGRTHRCSMPPPLRWPPCFDVIRSRTVSTDLPATRTVAGPMTR